MKLLTTTFITCLLLASCSSGKKTTNESKAVTLTNYNDSVAYALGVLYGKSLKDQSFDDVNTEILLSTFKQSIEGKLTDSSSLIETQNCNGIVNNYFIKKKEAVAIQNLAEGEAFLAKKPSRLF